MSAFEYDEVPAARGPVFVPAATAGLAEAAELIAGFTRATRFGPGLGYAPVAYTALGDLQEITTTVAAALGAVQVWLQRAYSAGHITCDERVGPPSQPQTDQDVTQKIVHIGMELELAVAALERTAHAIDQARQPASRLAVDHRARPDRWSSR
jgi:hypothetical protein